MALPWLTALKVIPWGDVIEHAPKVLKGARKLMERQSATPAPVVPPGPPLDPNGEPPSLGELRNRLIEARQLIDQQAAVQQQTAQMVTELAEQNARLVDAVNKLRLRTRMLIWAVLALTAPGPRRSRRPPRRRSPSPAMPPRPTTASTTGGGRSAAPAAAAGAPPRPSAGRARLRHR